MRYIPGLIIAGTATVSLIACTANMPTTTPSTRTAVSTSSVVPNYGCPANIQPTLDPNSAAFLAGDISAASSQTTVDCFAWQSFIALNWPVDPAWPSNPEQAGEPDRTASATTWGDPQNPDSNNPASTVWETFKPVQDVFVPAGKTPDGWGVTSAPPPACQAANNALFQGTSGTVRTLSMTSELQRPFLPRLKTLLTADANGLDPGSIEEAAGGWLTDQEGNLVWYGRLVNRAEFQYLMQPDGISADALYTPTGQQAVATNANGQHPKGLSFPLGAAPQGTQVQPWSQLGAVEIKSAWRILTNQPRLWPRYLLTRAYLTNPTTGACQPAILGLVGLHIIRNTKTFPNFYWSTFEHVDNAPQPNALYTDPYTHPFGYSFYNPNCSTHCTPNQPRRDENGKPLFPMSQPVQVERTFAISKNIMALNLAMHQAIVKQNPDSVFQYYQLVNVEWDQSASLPVTSPNKKAPLYTGSMTSDQSLPVANTTLETYVQGKNCTSCHGYAAISGNSNLASDFSFTFLETQAASSHSSSGSQKHP